MIKTLLAIATVATLGLSGAAFAQETIGANGNAVDGHGAAGSQQNRYHSDGPSGGYVTQSADGTCYLHSGSNVLVVRCAR